MQPENACASVGKGHGESIGRTLMKLLVKIPQGHEPERRYVLDVLLGEFLGLDFEVFPYDDRVVRILGGDSKECQIVDGLFRFTAADWLTPRSLPASPLK